MRKNLFFPFVSNSHSDGQLPFKSSPRLELAGLSGGVARTEYSPFTAQVAV